MSVNVWLGCLCLWLVVISGSLRAESGLNGVAVYSELGNELFVAALYSGQTGTNAQELINGSYTKRIELKVLSRQGITQRQFSRIWRESVAINNTRNVLIAQVDNLVYFESLIRDRLEPNDHLVISYAPEEGVVVRLNTVLLGRINDDAFFNVLLQSWIGLVPPSSKFRDDLLAASMADQTLVNRFINMYPRIARIETVKGWRQPINPERRTEPGTEIQKPLVEVAAAQESAAEKRQAVTVKNAPVKNEAHNQKVTADVAAVKQSVPIPVALTGARNVPVPQGLSEAQMLLAKQFYIADVFKKIYAQVNYPRRAQELQQVGTVKLSVVIDAVGNVKALAPVDKSKFLLLNKAAVAAVNSAAPFPPLPQGLALAELELFVPITFSLGVF